MKYEVWVAGPDDIHNFQDELTALRCANEINKYFLSSGHAFKPNAPLCVAIVREKKDSKDQRNAQET